MGGGPASLYFSILMKLRDPAHEISVHERNPRGSTYGWGVTYWRGLLDRLQAGDPVSARAIRDASVRWGGGVAHVRGTTTTQQGDEGFGVGRHRMLEILAERAGSLGVEVRYEDEVTAEPDADLVVAGDGAGSALRERHADHFGTRTDVGANTYIWLGTTRVFDAFTFTFVETEHGWIWCYGYGYSADRSTCVVECPVETWQGLGLDRMSAAEGLELLERLFAGTLDGHRLIGRDDGRSQWLRFRTLTNRTWHRGNLVLMGDAAHTTHYSIGAGTTLALEDAMALSGALSGWGTREPAPGTPRIAPEAELRAAGPTGPATVPQVGAGMVSPVGAGSVFQAVSPPGPDTALAAALERYERERKLALLSVQSAARYSARWYENLPRYIDLPAPQMFALLGQRHSPLLPYVPPSLYYRADRIATRLEPLRKAKRWLGPRLARTLHSRT
ncbi:FAD-dependent monooxygenase [Nonomuraea longicatena]|uniref:FAD-dependent monooxygenase n=1 Tax=Nonomuraea longicatena TaxID=83682 RepID=A0ABN1P9H6_9ACTN